MTDLASTDASDIAEDDWIDRFAPPGLRPYLRLIRLDRPIGTWLLLFPCWWSVALATPGWPEAWLIVLFGAGALIMRGAGCVFNDITDRNLDRRVARTAMRPLASGQVSLGQAIAYMGLLFLLGLAVLWQFNLYAVVVGACSLPLIFLYPLMKRVTYWPQAVLGLTFNWGALLGWAAVQGELAAPALALYAAGLFWTLGYDTIYAHQDKEDDLLFGVKSSALKLGANTRPWLFVFYAAAAALIGLAGHLAGLAWPFYAALAAATAQLAWQAGSVDIDDAKDCLAKFKSNRLFSWILLGGIIAGQIAR